jgi:hypothetical protein
LTVVLLYVLATVVSAAGPGGVRAVVVGARQASVVDPQSRQGALATPPAR